jgi:hypothetical protein
MGTVVKTVSFMHENVLYLCEFVALLEEIER